MSQSQPDREDIWLTNLKFTRQWQEEEVEEAPETKGGSEKYSAAALLRGHSAPPKSFSQPDVNKSNPYDRLAADKPGDELTPDSTIWKLYVNEAKEHDEELVLAKNRNLDMMLVFAALFSAILTAFLLDSKNLMQQDATDTSNQLLQRIAERLENPNGPFSAVDNTPFSPSSSARWINGLWFTALVFSLSAALIAMMAKEWLDSFVSSRPRPAHAYTTIRQARLDALYSWGALHIIDFLPLLLHISLLMFSLGLVVYLYSEVDTTVATIVSLITGVTALFYLITNTLGTFSEICPFSTQISHSTRSILRYVSNNWKIAARYKHYFVYNQPKTDEETTEQDLHALRWLATHAQDPLVGDSSYHALSGLRSGRSSSKLAERRQPASSQTPPKDAARKIGPPNDVESSPSGSSLDPSRDVPTVSRSELTTKPVRKDKLITNMFIDVCRRLGEARSARAHDLEVSCGASVARYAATLPCLVNYLLPHPDRNLLIWLADNRRIKLGLARERFDPSKQALDALDSILDNTCPPFTADAYAWITAAELRLVTDIAGSLKFTRNSQLFVDLDSKSQYTRRSSTAAETLISVTQPVIDPRHISKVTFFDLRARYSRSLARASFQMFFHSNDRAPMSAFSLISLLESLEAAATCEDLNQNTRDGPNSPELPLSTHHPQSLGSPTQLPDFNVFLVGAGDSYELRSGEIGDPCGLLAGILGILGASGARNVPGVELAAASALNRIAPMLLKQLLGHSTKFEIPLERLEGHETSITPMDDRKVVILRRATQGEESDVPPKSPLSPNSPSTKSFSRARIPHFANDAGWPIRDLNLSIAHWSLGQMLVLGAFAKLRQKEPGVGELSRLSLRAFDHRLQSCFPRSTAFTIAETHSRELRYLVDNFDQVESGVTDADSANTHLLQILALKEDRTIYSALLADQLGGPSQLLKIMQNAFAPGVTIETLLADVSSSAEKYWSYFADTRIPDDQGFSQLLKIGEHHAYKPAVARCIFQITRTAAIGILDRRNPVIELSVIGVFFEATRFVLNHHASDPKKPLDLYAFVGNMFDVIRAFDPKEDQHIKKHIPRKEVKTFLKTISKNTTLKTQVLEDLEKRWKKPGEDEHQDEHPGPSHSKHQTQPGHQNVPENHEE